MRGGGVTRPSVHSVKNPKRIRKIRHLLSAWDEPQKGEVAYGQMDRALACLQKIHTATIGTSADGACEPMEIAKRSAVLLGMPPQAATPLLARTFAANLRVRDPVDLATGP